MDSVLKISHLTVSYTQSFRGEKVALDDRLCRDAGMVCSGHPQRLKAGHLFPSDEDVLEGCAKGMAHMEIACDVWRGHHDTKRRLLGCRVGMEETDLFPAIAPAGFDSLGGIGGW